MIELKNIEIFARPDIVDFYKEMNRYEAKGYTLHTAFMARGDYHAVMVRETDDI